MPVILPVGHDHVDQRSSFLLRHIQTREGPVQLAFAMQVYGDEIIVMYTTPLLMPCSP